MGPRTHFKALRDPLQRHGCAGAQLARDFHLSGIAFAPVFQLRLRPASPGQFLFQHPFGMHQVRLPQFRSVVVPARSVHLGQKFVFELFISQEPASLDGPPVGLGVLLLATMLHALGKVLASGGAVFGNAPFSQEPVGAQPADPLAGRLEVETVTAPGVGLQRLAGFEQLGADRIQMDVIADCLEIPITAAMHDERLVTAGKEVAEFLVPAIETDGVGAQQPLHARHEVGLGRLDDQVKVVAHETIGVHLPTGLLTGLAQGLEEPVPVLIVVEDLLAAVATVHQVVDGSRILHSKLARHRWQRAREGQNVNSYDRPLSRPAFAARLFTETSRHSLAEDKLQVFVVQRENVAFKGGGASSPTLEL